MVHLLEALAELGFVVHFVPANLLRHEPYSTDLEAHGIEVVSCPLDPLDYIVSLGDALAFVIVSRPDVGERFVAPLRHRLPQVPLVYDMVDSHALREQRRADTSTDPAEAREAARAARRYRALEARLAALCDATIAVSEGDADELRRNVAGPVSVVIVPNIHLPRPDPPPFDTRHGILFLGGYEHPPNVDAAIVAARDVLPLVRTELPDVTLTLAGSKMPARLRELGGNGVVPRGWVEDLGEVFSSHRLFLAPLRYGAGVKGKIGESLSWGLPTVTTTIGVEGLDAIDGEHLVVADDPAAMAAAVTGLYTDGARWSAMSVAGRKLVDDRYGLDATRQRLLGLLSAIDVDVVSR
jgi:glycosyltransferase involved in cell wall biosynthesis